MQLSFKNCNYLKPLFIILGALLLTSCQISSNKQGAYVNTAQPIANENIQLNYPKANQIALLVPLSGKFASSGKAVKNGFFAAYYANNSSSSQPIVKIYNTSDKPIDQIYKEAVDNGASLIIGPLTRQKVAEINQMGNLPIPTITLNEISVNANEASNLYQFSLSQSDEAIQTADRIFQNGYRRVLVIAPAGSWGKSVADSFTQQWQTLGGNISEELFYKPNENLSKAIAKVLDISSSEKRSNELTRILGEQPRAIPHRRQDIDAIFLLAVPQTAREIRPLLKFYFAGSIPVYSTSLIYNGTSSADSNRDLDGIIFPDMPWFLNPNAGYPASRSQLASLWQRGFNQEARFYALGMDAYLIAENLNHLPSGLNGATGTLYLTSDRHISRKLMWAKFVNGEVKRI